MNEGAGNLSRGERVGSALLGLGLTWFFTRRDSAILKLLGGVAGASLIGRAFAGHCAMKAAMTGESTFTEGIADQWRRTTEAGRRIADRVAESTGRMGDRQRSDDSESLGDVAMSRGRESSSTSTTAAPF